MSSDLAIAAVSAVLRQLLHDGVVDHDVLGAQGPVKITAEAPDLIKTEGVDLPDLINLFMYHVTPNPGWRNFDLPSRDARGSRISNPPLALDLYYLVTAYSPRELYAEILLGYAMDFLHETAVLTREAIQKVLSPPLVAGAAADLPPALQILGASDLADQVEQIKITPYVMSTEEMSKLWTAFQAHYRPSAVYLLSVVLMQRKRPARSPLPALTIGPWNPMWKQPEGVAVAPDLVAPAPTLTELSPPNQQTAIRMGEILTLKGFHLADGPGTVHFTHMKTGKTLDIVGGSATPTSLPAQLPAASNDWRGGVYSLFATIGTGTAARITNSMPIALAPKILTMARGGGGALATLTIACAPKVWKDQQVSCTIIEHEFFPKPPAPADPDPLDQLVFEFDPAEFAGRTAYVRLRVDGVESILVDRSATPPAFFASEILPP